MAPGAVLYIAWLRAEDWPRWREICNDLPATHAEWLARPDPVIKGADVTDMRKVEIRPDEFMVWCRACGSAPDKIGRTRYAIALGTSLDERLQP